MAKSEPAPEAEAPEAASSEKPPSGGTPPPAQTGAGPATGGIGGLTSTVTAEVLKNFPTQTPGVYRWTVGAVGFLMFAMVVATLVQPEAVVAIVCTAIFMILLIFLLFSFEKEDIDTKWQSRVLAWFSVLVLIVASSAIVSSVLSGWPLTIVLGGAPDRATVKGLVDSYMFRDSRFFRVSDGQWRQEFDVERSRVHNFKEVGLSVDYLLLYDDTRKLHIRIPTAGGMVEWSKAEDINDCLHQHCWGDVQGVDVKMKPVALFAAH